MNDSEATRLFERAAEALIPDEPAPLPSLLTAAKQGQRQKSRRVIVLAAASVALVLGGGAVVQQVMDSGQPSPDKPSQNLTSDVPTAPDGKVLVGMGQVVVAVPDSWGRLPNGCHIPRGNVYFEPVHAQDCWMGSYGSSGRTQPTLGFSVLGDTDLTAFEPLDVVNGALVSEANCDISGDRDCRERIALPDLRVLLTLRWDVADGAAAIAGEVRDSLHLLPEGYTTVPYIEPGTFNFEAAERLIADGLTIAPIVDIDDEETPITGTAPEAGSVIEVGSDVRLLYPGGNDAGPSFSCPAKLSDKSVRQGSTVAPPPVADEPPLPSPDRAWVCEYNLDFSDTNERPHETWLPSGPAVEADADGLTRLTRLLATMRLQPDSNPGGPCPANLGPIWLLVVEHAGARSGLTYADFGCGTLQLTEGERYKSYESTVSLHEVGGLPETLSYVYTTGTPLS